MCDHQLASVYKWRFNGTANISINSYNLLLQLTCGNSLSCSPLHVSRSQTLIVPLAAPAATWSSDWSNVTHSTGDCSPTRLCKHAHEPQHSCDHENAVKEDGAGSGAQYTWVGCSQRFLVFVLWLVARKPGLRC
eukprot:GHRQ01021009.1.p1 GENE.GHRQ01021009.1~~GHRQ01021009.1.p1  ORF type:complete len:134 (-),score=12.69 GHRQ01021009.1:593-994(-)